MYELTIAVAKDIVGSVAGEIAKETHYHSDIVLVYAGAINVLVFVLWWVVKRWVGNIDTWRGDAGKAGGFITRQQYFEWCKPQQDKCREGLICRTEDIEKWRESIMDKGGAVTFQEHLAGCEKVGEKTANAFAKRIDELMLHHREWVGGQLELLSEKLGKRMLEGFGQLRKEVEQDRRKDGGPGRP